jgi:hypothetical protein
MSAAAPAKNYAPSQPGLVPPAVRRQAAEAERLMAELNAKPTPAPAPTAPAAAAAAAAAAPAAPPPASQMQPAAPVQQPAPAPVQTAEERAAALEHRLSVLQGKYHAEGAALRAQLEQTNSLVKDLLTRPAPAPAAPVPAPVQQSDEEILLSLGVKPKQIEEYGAELLMLMARIGSSTVTPQIQALAQEQAQLRQQAQGIAGVQNQNSQQAVYAALNEKVPAWSAINHSEEFKDWLSKVDVFSGVSKHTSLLDAFKKFDATRVVAIFQAYEQESAGRSAAPPAVDPATLITPQPRGQAPVAPEGSGKKIWSEAEIRDFYQRVRKKKVSPEEYESTQRDLALAAAEGRIRPDNVGFQSNNM